MIGYIFGGVVILLILVYTIAGAAWVFTDLIPNAYRTLRFDRKNICYRCRRPFKNWHTASDGTSQGVCDCGTVSMPRGNRRWVDWAPF